MVKNSLQNKKNVLRLIYNKRYITDDLLQRKCPPLVDKMPKCPRGVSDTIKEGNYAAEKEVFETTNR